MKKGIEAMHKLTHMGYRFTVDGENLGSKYEGPGEPDLETAQPLLETVKAHKPEVMEFIIKNGDEREKKNLAIIFNSVDGDVSCALCNELKHAKVGFAMCLANSGQVVCQKCAEKHDPALEEHFGTLMSLKRHKAHMDESLPWLFRKLETIFILGTTLKLNEKEDIAYMGGKLSSTADTMQNELKSLGPCESYEPVIEIPF